MCVCVTTDMIIAVCEEGPCLEPRRATSERSKCESRCWIVLCVLGSCSACAACAPPFLCALIGFECRGDLGSGATGG